ncbi:7798_t:CDS:2, partial [Racocetra fulgida]
VTKHAADFLNTDPSKLQLGMAYPTTGTYKAVLKRVANQTLSEMLQTIYLPNTPRLLYYEILDINITELENNMLFKEVIDVLIPKDAIINEILNEIVKKLSLPIPTSRIRLYDTDSFKIQNEYNFDDPIDKIPDQVTLYAEEIPQEELELYVDDKIIQVFHFTKETLCAHGIPFKFVLKADEPFSQTKLRLQLRLGMNEKDFSKVKIAVVQDDVDPEYIYVDDD